MVDQRQPAQARLLSILVADVLPNQTPFYQSLTGLRMLEVDGMLSVSHSSLANTDEREESTMTMDAKLKFDFEFDSKFDKAAVCEAVPQVAQPSAADEPDGLWLRFGGFNAVAYWAIHASCLLAFYTGVNTTDLILFAFTFWVRMFGITAGFHRYFSHRSYKTSRAMQFVLAVIGTSAIQKGPLWWAGAHRLHHRYSDLPGDPHSPRVSFWYAHQGWIFDPQWHETRIREIRDFAKYPELIWLNQWHIVPPILLGALCYGIGGFSGLIWGMAISSVACWHGTYTINSLAHRWGSTRFETGDDSRNNFFFALLTLGEGWHNNHHRFMNSTRQGFYWWEIDISYYILCGMNAVGLIWDMKRPPASVYKEAKEAAEAAKAAAAAQAPSTAASHAQLVPETASIR
jgi:stearoyl-CoA desaturase (delta-9 desaturase)